MMMESNLGVIQEELGFDCVNIHHVAFGMGFGVWKFGALLWH